MESNEGKNITPELTITDLTNLRSVLELSFRRGAFTAAEASSVGMVFDRLNNFLNSISQNTNDKTPNKE